MFETVNTHQLKVGDRVHSHGCVFELVERRSREEKDFPEWGDVVWFTTKCLYHNKKAMPKSWAESWIIQGNLNATWVREKE